MGSETKPLEGRNFHDLFSDNGDLKKISECLAAGEGIFSSSYIWTIRDYTYSFQREEKRSGKCYQQYMDFQISLKSREIACDNGSKKEYYEINLMVCAAIENLFFESKNCFPGLRPNFDAEIFIFSNHKKFRMPNVDSQSLKFMMRKKSFKENVCGKDIVIGVNVNLIYPATIRNDGSEIYLAMYIRNKGDYGDLKDVGIEECNVDFTLKSKSSEFLGEFPVHKHVMSAKSEVFSTLLQGNPQMRVIEIADATPEDLNNFVRFLYHRGHFANRMSDKEFRNLYVIALKYKVHDLARVCEKHILCRITLDNVVETLKFGRVNNLQKIEEAAIGFIAKAKLLMSRNDIETLRDLDSSLLVNIMWKISEIQLESA